MAVRRESRAPRHPDEESRLSTTGLLTDAAGVYMMCVQCRCTVLANRLGRHPFKNFTLIKPPWASNSVTHHDPDRPVILSVSQSPWDIILHTPHILRPVCSPKLLPNLFCGSLSSDSRLVPVRTSAVRAQCRPSYLWYPSIVTSLALQESKP